MGWSLTKLEKYDEAQKAFYLPLKLLHFSSSLAPGAAFWYAVIEEQKGNTDKSKESFEYILKDLANIWICLARRSLSRKGISQKKI